MTNSMDLIKVFDDSKCFHWYFWEVKVIFQNFFIILFKLIIVICEISTPKIHCKHTLILTYNQCGTDRNAKHFTLMNICSGVNDEIH